MLVFKKMEILFYVMNMIIYYGKQVQIKQNLKANFLDLILKHGDLL
jgi:hypothetical protein